MVRKLWTMVLNGQLELQDLAKTARGGDKGKASDAASSQEKARGAARTVGKADTAEEPSSPTSFAGEDSQTPKPELEQKQEESDKEKEDEEKDKAKKAAPAEESEEEEEESDMEDDEEDDKAKEAAPAKDESGSSTEQPDYSSSHSPSPAVRSPGLKPKSAAVEAKSCSKATFVAVVQKERASDLAACQVWKGASPAACQVCKGASPACQGSSSAACPACQGSSSAACPACQGSNSAACPACQGSSYSCRKSLCPHAKAGAEAGGVLAQDHARRELGGTRAQSAGEALLGLCGRGGRGAATESAAALGLGKVGGLERQERKLELARREDKTWSPYPVSKAPSAASSQSRARSKSPKAHDADKGKGKGVRQVGGWQNKAAVLVAKLRKGDDAGAKALAEKFMQLDDFAKVVLRHEAIVEKHGRDDRFNFDL